MRKFQRFIKAVHLYLPNGDLKEKKTFLDTFLQLSGPVGQVQFI